jgi:hypothetical protein
MMIYSIATALVYIVVFIAVVVVQALPSGAPVCTIGEAAPGNPHTAAERSPLTGPLSMAGFIVKIGDETLNTSTPITVQAYEDLRVEITSESGEQPFRGALMIVSKTGGVIEEAFTLNEADASKLQINTLCAPSAASGVTHVNNELKTSVGATLRFDENIQEVLLDVNVVVINRIASEGGSIYYYSQFKINVIGATPPPTRTPTRTPTRKCGIFGLGLFCPFKKCWFLYRLIFGDVSC